MNFYTYFYIESGAECGNSFSFLLPLTFFISTAVLLQNHTHATAVLLQNHTHARKVVSDFLEVAIKLSLLARLE
jgi:hypothetical protein